MDDDEHGTGRDGTDEFDDDDGYKYGDKYGTTTNASTSTAPARRRDGGGRTVTGRYGRMTGSGDETRQLGRDGTAGRRRDGPDGTGQVTMTDDDDAREHGGSESDGRSDDDGRHGRRRYGRHRFRTGWMTDTTSGTVRDGATGRYG